MQRLIILLLCLFAAALSYTIKPNPDAGDFTIFPLVTMGEDDFPTTMAFANDGRIFIALKNGIVKVVDVNGNLQDEPWLDLTSKVMSSGDKGLTAFKLHPQFPSVPYVYTFYPLLQGTDKWNMDLNRVTQGVLARYSEVNGKGSLSSELLLIGKTNGTGTPSCHNSHVTGDIVFANDGTLFASAGEGSHWDAVDDGTDYDFDPYDWQCAPFFGKDADIGSFRAQELNNIGGKVMRIDPATGNGIGADNFPKLVPNPFYDAAHPDSFASIIWTIGHRNPWKLRLIPSTGPGTLVVAEAGAKDYEEINVIKPSQAGSNYGWPCQTANRRLQPWFTNTSGPAEYYVPIYPTNQNTVDKCNNYLKKLGNSVEPIFYYSRTQYVYGEFIGVLGNCVSGMDFYSGTNYPESYRPTASGTRALFISDFGNQWIKVIHVDNNGNYIDSLGVQDFLDNVGRILEIVHNPTNGDLYYITEDGDINRIRYTAGYVGAPIINTLKATPQTQNINKGASGVVQFSSDGAFDPAGLGLNFTWSFGDNSADSTLPNPSHTYTTAGTYKVTLTLTNGAGYSATHSTTVATNNNAPTATIAGPAWFQFVDKQEVTLNADFNDDETDRSQLQYQWEYRIVHNNHYHPNVVVEPATMPNKIGTGPISDDTQTYSKIISAYERNMLEVYVTVMDSVGASSRTMVRAVPNYPGNANVNTNAKPVAKFTSEQMGSAVYFTAGSTTDADFDFLTFSWNWGDGTTGTGQVTYHTYATPGAYTVTLTVEDPWQATDTMSSSVNVVTPKPYVAPSTGNNGNNGNNGGNNGGSSSGNGGNNGGAETSVGRGQNSGATVAVGMITAIAVFMMM